MNLFAPRSYIKATDKEKRAVCNGCGTSGWKGELVPETVWGLSITAACNIHDWMYHTGESICDKDEADRAFLNNMLRVIDNAGGNWLIKKLRRRRARTYYIAVRDFGGPAFWAGKNAGSLVNLSQRTFDKVGDFNEY